MNDGGYPAEQKVLDGLGSDFLQVFVDAVAGAREDYAVFRREHPDWLAGFASRSTAAVMHERLWGRLIALVDALEGIRIVDEPPVREIIIGMSYRARIKRHHLDDTIASYPTASSLAFWAPGAATFDGLEQYSLALGYEWDEETREPGAAVVSLRDGTQRAIWKISLDRDEEKEAGFTWSSVEPRLPQLDLSAVLTEADDEEDLA